MGYELSSGQVAAALRERGLRIATSTVQRYAREGLLPCRPTPGGRYRFDLTEVLATFAARSPARMLGGAPLTGGLGVAELPVDSPAERLRRGTRGHVSGTAVAGPAPKRVSAVRDQLAHSARRSLALA